jgi:hypothetical protein
VEAGAERQPERPRRGSRNKYAEQFFTDFYNDWQQFGVKVIEEVRTTNPYGYLRVAASLLPRLMHIRSESAFAGVSDEELNNVLGEIRRQLLTRAGNSGGAGSKAPSSSDKLN